MKPNMMATDDLIKMLIFIVSFGLLVFVFVLAEEAGVELSTVK